MAVYGLMDLTYSLNGKYGGPGTLSAPALQSNITAICNTVAAGTLSWVNEDCIVLINNTGTTLYEGMIVSISPSNVIDGCVLATQASDDFLCGVVYRGGDYQQPVVVAIQGEYPVIIPTSPRALSAAPVTGNIITISSTPGYGRILTSQVGGINIIGICAETGAIPEVLLQPSYYVKCMIQNLQSL
jgi:hypothetical protein